MVVPPGTASASVAAIAPATSTAVAATTVAATTVAGAVGIDGLGRQTVGVRRGGRPEDTLRRGRVAASEGVAEGVRDNCELLGEKRNRTRLLSDFANLQSLFRQLGEHCRCSSHDLCRQVRSEKLTAAHRRHAVDTAVQKGTALANGRVGRSGGTGPSRSGKSSHSVDERGAQAGGVDPSPRSRGSHSGRSTLKIGQSQTRRVGGPRLQLQGKAQGLYMGFPRQQRQERPKKRVSAAVVAEAFPSRRCLSTGLARSFSARRTAASAACDSLVVATIYVALARPPSSHSRRVQTLSLAAAQVRRSAVGREESALAFVAFAVASASFLARTASFCLREASWPRMLLEAPNCLGSASG